MLGMCRDGPPLTRSRPVSYQPFVSEGTDVQKEAAFATTARYLRNGIATIAECARA
jgi:hypothetical protein